MADVRTQERILTCSEIKFLTPPVSPGPERSKLKTFTPPLTPTFRRRKSKSNLDLSFKSNRKENVSVFPYLEKEKKDWYQQIEGRHVFYPEHGHWRINRLFKSNSNVNIFRKGRLLLNLKILFNQLLSIFYTKIS